MSPSPPLSITEHKAFATLTTHLILIPLLFTLWAYTLYHAPQRRQTVRDIAISLGCWTFLGMTGAYLALNATNFAVARVTHGQAAPWDGIAGDARWIARTMVAGSFAQRVVMLCVRVSFLMHYADLIRGANVRWHRILWGCALGLSVFTLFYGGILELFACGADPGQLVQGKGCHTPADILVSQAQAYGEYILTVITDLLIMVPPVVVIWKLQMSTIDKLSASFVFLLGLASLFGSTARFIIVSTTDQAWIAVLAFLQICETGDAVVMSLMPAIYCYIRDLYQKRGARKREESAQPIELSRTGTRVSDAGSMDFYEFLAGERLRPVRMPTPETLSETDSSGETMMEQGVARPATAHGRAAGARRFV